MPAIGAPYSAWIWKVSQRNAPGAISAMAFIVSPVRPSVLRFGVAVGAACPSAIVSSSSGSGCRLVAGVDPPDGASPAPRHAAGATEALPSGSGLGSTDGQGSLQTNLLLNPADATTPSAPVCA